ncbi:hypothetical protein OS493_022624, partial [Desmophyllum pertusum]
VVTALLSGDDQKSQNGQGMECNPLEQQQRPSKLTNSPLLFMKKTFRIVQSYMTRTSCSVEALQDNLPTQKLVLTCQILAVYQKKCVFMFMASAESTDPVSEKR